MAPTVASTKAGETRSSRRRAAPPSCPSPVSKVFNLQQRVMHQTRKALLPTAAAPAASGQTSRCGQAPYAVEITAAPDRLAHWQRLPPCPAGAVVRRAGTRP